MESNVYSANSDESSGDEKQNKPKSPVPFANSPAETVKEKKDLGPLRRFRILSDIAQFADNSIRTSKYTLASFLPLNFLYQLTKAANLYFIGIICLQMIPAISISGGQPTNLPPLLFVIVISMIKDFIEDRARRKSDAKENDATVECLQFGPEGKTVLNTVSWKELQVGQIVKIYHNQYFPADLILLHSSEYKGICFVETKSLDGETNLKNKGAPNLLVDAGITEESLLKLNQFSVTC